MAKSWADILIYEFSECMPEGGERMQGWGRSSSKGVESRNEIRPLKTFKVSLRNFVGLREAKDPSHFASCRLSDVDTQIEQANESLDYLKNIDPRAVIAGGALVNWRHTVTARDLDFYVYTDMKQEEFQDVLSASGKFRKVRNFSLSRESVLEKVKEMSNIVNASHVFYSKTDAFREGHTIARKYVSDLYRLIKSDNKSLDDLILAMTPSYEDDMSHIAYVVSCEDLHGNECNVIVTNDDLNHKVVNEFPASFCRASYDGKIVCMDELFVYTDLTRQPVIFDHVSTFKEGAQSKREVPSHHILKMNNKAKLFGMHDWMTFHTLYLTGTLGAMSHVLSLEGYSQGNLPMFEGESFDYCEVNVKFRSCEDMTFYMKEGNAGALTSYLDANSSLTKDMKSFFIVDSDGDIIGGKKYKQGA